MLQVQSSSGTKVTLPSDREIVIVRSFDAPRALVFETWTRPEHVAQWWDPTGTPLAVCEIDLRVGGAFRFVNAANVGGEQVFAGIYREITPPSQLVLATPSPAGESTGTLIFAEEGRTTTLTMTMTCASKAQRDALLAMRVDVGTTQTLNNLAEYLGALKRG